MTRSISAQQLQRLFRVAGWGQFVLLTGYATYLSLAPSPGSVFESVWDKLLHVICWFVLTLSLRLAWPRSSFPLRAALGLFAYSVLVEFLQHFTPERHFNPYDLLGNGLGVVVAYILALLLWPTVERCVVRYLL